MALKPPIHGRDHCLGGADPIPCLSTPWARRRLRTAQTIQSGVLTSIDFGSDTNDFTSDFTIMTVSGEGKGIQVLKDGLYGFLCRISGGSLATEAFIDINNFGPTTAVEYELYSYPFPVSAMAIGERDSGAAFVMMRVLANSRIVPFVRHAAGADRTISDGTFFEVFRLSTNVTVTGLDWP